MADTPVTSFTTFAAATDIDLAADLIPVINVDGTGATLMKKVPPSQLLEALLSALASGTALRVVSGAFAAADITTAKTSDDALTAADTHETFTNEGAGAQVILTLPTAAANLRLAFYVQEAQNLRILANTDDTIRLSSAVSAAAGYAESSTVGSAIILHAINATEWVALSIVGTWNVV